MAAHELDFLRGVALVIQGESMKAGAYVKHNASLGTLREKMVSRFIRDETPDRLRVETGLIRNNHTGASSRQCDLLVHEASITPPVYRWEDFVIAEVENVRAVVEVKSNVDERGFDDIVAVHQSVIECRGAADFAPPVLAYGLAGVTFESFVEYVAATIKDNKLGLQGESRVMNVPECIAVQDRHYVGERGFDEKDGVPRYFCAVNFEEAEQGSRLQPVNGLETGVLISAYKELLRRGRYALWGHVLYPPFNDLPVKDSGKVWIDANGTVHRGRIPIGV